MIAIREVEDRLGGVPFYVQDADAEGFFVYIIHLDTVLGYCSCAVVLEACLFFMCVGCCQGGACMTRQIRAQVVVAQRL